MKEKITLVAVLTPIIINYVPQTTAVPTTIPAE